MNRGRVETRVGAADAKTTQLTAEADSRQGLSHPVRRERKQLPLALLLSLLIHSLLLSAFFGGQQRTGLAGLDFPWRDRRVEVAALRVRLVPPQTPAPAPAAPGAAVAKRLQQATIEPSTALRPGPPPSASPPPAVRRATAATVRIATPTAGNAGQAPLQPRTAGDAISRAAAPDDALQAPSHEPAVIATPNPHHDTWVVPPAPPVSPPPMPVIATAPSASSPAQLQTKRFEDKRLDVERREAAMRAAAAQEAALQDVALRVAAREVAAQREAARLEAEQEQKTQREMARRAEAQQEAARQDAAGVEISRLEVARLEVEQLEATRQRTARRVAERQEVDRLEAAQRESARLEAEKQQTAQNAAQRAEVQQEAVRQEAARVEVTRLEAARLELEQQEATRQQTARRIAEQQELSRREAAQRESARLEAEKDQLAQKDAAQRAEAQQEAARQQALERQADARRAAEADDAARQEAARRATATAAEERREAARRALGRQLDEEADRRDATAAVTRSSSPLPTSLSSARRGRLFGRIDANSDLVLYAEAWARKIQFNTPSTTVDTVREAMKQRGANPVVTVAIRRDGSVESVTFVLSSGVGETDEAIRRIVQSQEPYPAFSPALIREFDVIEIRRTWHFDIAVRLY